MPETAGVLCVMADKLGTWNISVPHGDLTCPICRDLISDVYSAPCGHSFCYNCIIKNLEHRPLCPCCNAFVTKDKIYPNITLTKVNQRRVCLWSDRFVGSLFLASSSSLASCLCLDAVI